MSQPSHFKQVIQRVIERSPRGLAAADLAEKIVEGLDLAEAILGDGPVSFSGMQVHQPSGQTRINPSPPRLLVSDKVYEAEIRANMGLSYREPDLSKGLLIATEDTVFDTRTASFTAAKIIEEAPPNAYVRNPDAPILQESPEETERKKAELHGLILRSLPASMKLRLPNLPTIPNVEHNLDLKLAVLPSPAGMNFVRIRYGQHQGEEDAPQVQVSTQDTGFDPDSIKAEIVKQAEARYRAARPALAPRTPPSQGFPDPSILMAAANRNSATGTDDVVSKEDRDAWNKATGRTVI